MWCFSRVWSEFGMCTEPSAFGARCIFPINEFPHAHKVINPSMISTRYHSQSENRWPVAVRTEPLKTRPAKNWSGQDIISDLQLPAARWTLPSYLMGSTEFLTTMMMQPEKPKRLWKRLLCISKIGSICKWKHFRLLTAFFVGWHIGFMGEEEFRNFGMPYFKELYDANVSVKFCTTMPL